MAYAAIQIIIRNVRTGNPSVVVKTRDAGTGAFTHTERWLDGRSCKEVAQEALQDHEPESAMRTNMPRAHKIATDAAKAAQYSQKKGA
jgi:hypothetical protein